MQDKSKQMHAPPPTTTTNATTTTTIPGMRLWYAYHYIPPLHANACTFGALPCLLLKTRLCIKGSNFSRLCRVLKSRCQGALTPSHHYAVPKAQASAGNSHCSGSNARSAPKSVPPRFGTLCFASDIRSKLYTHAIARAVRLSGKQSEYSTRDTGTRCADILLEGVRR
jgi:hypothetical protein